VEREAAVFLETLALGPETLRRVSLIVLHLPEDRVTSNAFVDALDHHLAGERGSKPALQIHTLRLREKLDLEHFFRIDSHLNASGHRVVAETLLPEVVSLLGEP
jgi:hypothetical protein